MEFYIVPQPRETMQALAETNRKTARYGLTLMPEQMAALAESRTQALLDTGRVELGAGILPRLIEVFCDSPHLHQTDYAETLEALQTVFYRCKNEAGDLTPDGDLLRLLRERVEVVRAHRLPLPRIAHEVDGKGHERRGLLGSTRKSGT